MTTWSTHSGETPALSIAPREARAPSSRAETSLKSPTYSRMGVRAPPRMTTSSAIGAIPGSPERGKKKRRV
jgi:hypothetical protein